MLQIIGLLGTGKCKPAPNLGLTLPQTSSPPSSCGLFVQDNRKEPDGKNTKKDFAEAELFVEEISEDFSEDRRYHFYGILEHVWISSKSSQKFSFF